MMPTMLMPFRSPRILTLLLMLTLASTSLFGATNRKKRKAVHNKASAKVTASRATSRLTATRNARLSATKNARVSTAKKRKRAGSSHSRRLLAVAHSPRSHATARARRSLWSPWKEPTFADSTDGDFIDGEDITVRKAAVDALNGLNGTVVVADPSTGRILTMVNQRVALKSGFQPCSTIKVVAALAGLSEGLIDRETAIRLGRRGSMALTEAIARSNNPYFANVGERLGFERVNYYARLYGLGEKAGLNIPGEQAGTLPPAIPGEGLGMMTSFGSGISLTPLQLASLMGAIANGGTLFYLQYPRNQAEVDHFVPRVKRHLDIGQWLPEIKPGMSGAVEFGTARRVAYGYNQPVMGKTGTCTDSRTPTHLGWFGSYNEVGKKKLVVVVLLTGGRGVSGPAASGVAGQVYKNLTDASFFEQDPKPISPIALISSQTCCALSDSTTN